METRRSWVTQRLANRYPPWSRLRNLAQSVGQQMLEPLGREHEDAYWWANYDLGNSILNMSDCHQMALIKRVALPSTFTWRTEQNPDSIVYLKPTSVRGQLSSGTWITLEQAYNNKVEDFWFGIPDRITDAGQSYTYTAPLPQTQVSSLSSAVLTAPSIPGKLWVSMSSNEYFIKNYASSSLRPTVVMKGWDIHGKENEERVKFAFNGTIQTKLAWSDIDSVRTEYVDDMAFIQIDWLYPDNEEVIDTNGIHVTNKMEKFRFYSIGTEDYGSTLRHMVFSAPNLVTIQEGHDDRHAVHEIQLLDSSETNIDAVGFALWPKRRWIIVADTENLHFFPPSAPMEDLSIMVERTTEPVVQIELEEEWAKQGEELTLYFDVKRPLIKVLQTRWSVEKPDGTRVCIDTSGTESSYSSDGWVENEYGTRNDKVGMEDGYIVYTLTDKGRYVFYLEAMITDATKTRIDPITQTDVRVVHSAYDTAQASVALPSSVGEISRVSFDAYGRPWVLGDSGLATQVDFHYDKYLVDFTNNIVFVREDYSSVEVEA
jgi:hypothetical protein